MHSVCMVRPSPRRSSMHIHVLGEVGYWSTLKETMVLDPPHEEYNYWFMTKGLKYLIDDLVGT